MLFQIRNKKFFYEEKNRQITKREAKIAHQSFVADDNRDRWCNWKKQGANNTQLEAWHLSHLWWNKQNKNKISERQLVDVYCCINLINATWLILITIKMSSQFENSIANAGWLTADCCMLMHYSLAQSLKICGLHIWTVYIDELYKYSFKLFWLACFRSNM